MDGRWRRRRDEERVYARAKETTRGGGHELGKGGEPEREREEEEGSVRTKDKECGSQGVTRISFDGITWRLRVGTVITLVVYR